MERRPASPLYSRQKSISTSSTSSAAGMAPSSPVMSPMNRHVRSGSAGAAAFRRNQNYAARAAAQRLARVMAQSADDDSSDDDDLDPAGGPPIELSTPRRANRSPSPAIGRYLADQAPTVRPTSTGRPSMVGKPTAMIPPIKPSPKPLVTSVATESPVFHRREESPLVHRRDDSPLVHRRDDSSLVYRRDDSPQLHRRDDSPLVHRRDDSPLVHRRGDSPLVNRRDKRMSVDLGSLNARETSHPRSSSALEDEIDVLQEENENILGKLRLAEERCEEAEARVRQQEKQVASLGEGVSLEARQLSRREAALQRRESALRTAVQNSDGNREQIVSLQLEAKIARDEASSVAEHLQEAESEIKSLRTVAQKMMLNHEEMEEVVLKRCWLARYWKLCVHHGIHADIAEKKYENWSSFAPLPVEVVLSAGEKARDGCTSEKADLEEDKMPFDINDLVGEGNIENMLLVEKGLRELASLKVEDAVLLAMAQHRRTSIKAGQSTSGSMMAVEGPNPVEAFELSKEESEDVLFKQAWLTYFWRRVKNHGLEEDIADDRLQFWIDQSSHSPTSQDAVEVERGLFELKKLGIESQLWEVSRRGADPDSSLLGSQTESEF